MGSLARAQPQTNCYTSTYSSYSRQKLSSTYVLSSLLPQRKSSILIRSDNTVLCNYSSNLYSEQTGLQLQCGPEPNSPQPPSTLHLDGMVPLGSSHPGTSQCMGRLSVPRPHNQVRMGSLPEILQPDPPNSPPPNRPLRSSRERQATTVRLPLPPSSSHSAVGGCTISELESLDTNLPISPWYLITTILNKLNSYRGNGVLVTPFLPNAPW